MAGLAEGRMNLGALQQRDPYITEIVDTGSQVALYSFSSKTNEWEKTDVEGTLFVYTRSASPINGFMILNRLGLNDLIEPINKNLEFQLQDPFLLYRNAQAAIFGIWFYDKDECARIGQLMNSLVQVAIETQDQKESASGRQRRASESDTMVGASPVTPSSASSGKLALSQQKQVDIIQMLSKAQDQYDKDRSAGSSKGAEPKPMIDNPNAAATKSSTLPKPLAVKANSTPSPEPQDMGGMLDEPSTPTTQISLETLFQRASLHHEPRAPEELRAQATSQAAPPNSQVTSILQKLMANPRATVEEIERQQREETPREVFTKPAATDSSGVVAPCHTSPLLFPEPESPNTCLKRTLNIAPLASSKQGVSRQVPPVGGSTSTGVHHQRLQPMSAAQSDSQVSSQGRQGTSPLLTPLAAAMYDDVSDTTAKLGLLKNGSIKNVIDLPQAVPEVVGVGNVLATQAKKSEGLITPEDLCQTSAKPAASGSGASQLSQAASVLLSPMAFQSSVRLTPPTGSLSLMVGQPTIPSALSDTASTHSLSPQQNGLEQATTKAPQITPLTKQQLQQALIYLLKNDHNFVSAIHDAYVKSLHQELSSKMDRL